MSNLENLGQQWVDEIIDDLKKRCKRVSVSLDSLEKPGHYADAHKQAIEVLDRAISAALATPPVASGALPELPELPTHAVLYTQNGYRRASVKSHAGEPLTLVSAAAIQMRAYGQACAAAAASNAALVESLTALLRLIDEFGIKSGVCCCGDDMERHDNPMDCGHSPVDSGEYYSESAIEAARAALAQAGEVAK